MAPFVAPRCVLSFLALAAAHRAAEGQSIAASLSQYQATVRVASVAGATAKSFSGAAFHPATRDIYVVDNDNANVYVLDTAGVLLRTIATTGFADPEGIAWQSDDWFLIAEEGLADIVRVKLPRAGNGPAAKPASGSLGLGPNMANSGIEGVAYRAADNAAFAAKEIDPPRLYRLALDAAGNPVSSQAGAPFDVAGRSGDIADIAALDDGNFILVNQEGNRLEGYGPQGQALSTLPLGMSKPEGLAVDAATGTLYVVGEPMEFRVFKKAGTAAHPAAGNGYAASLARGASGSARELRFLLPRPSEVRVDFATPSGAWTRIFRGTMEPGPHVLPLPSTGPGVGFYRFSAGDYSRVLTRAPAP